MDDAILSLKYKVKYRWLSLMIEEAPMNAHLDICGDHSSIVDVHGPARNGERDILVVDGQRLHSREGR
jgi:hypothetical protein